MPAQPTSPMTTKITGKRGLHRGRNGDEEEQGGKGQSDVGQPHHQGIDPTAVVAGQQPEKHAQGHRDRLGDHPHRQRNPGAIQHPAQDVAALGIGAQQVPGTRFDQVSPLQVAGEGVMGGQPGGKQGGDDQEAHEQEAQLEEPVAAQSGPAEHFVASYSRDVGYARRWGPRTSASIRLSPRWGARFLQIGTGPS